MQLGLLFQPEMLLSISFYKIEGGQPSFMTTIFSNFSQSMFNI